MTIEYDQQSGSFDARGGCQWCGTGILHSGTCPRIKVIEYGDYGTIKRIEFVPEQPEHQHQWLPWLTLPNGSSWTMCGDPTCDVEVQYDH